MKAETALYALLNASSELGTLVSSRIYLDTRPEADPLPAVVYELVSDKQDNTRVGEFETAKARLQVNCLGQMAEDAANVREAVKMACHNQSGVLGGVTVLACIQSGAGTDSYDELVNIYVKPMDFMVHYLR
ncbi:DUF3168 domain-containing protein [Ferrovum sp.]|jgi:hypothetical protein|uniref:tail completion protein gp17 n=1 Tax=Ferrovum sp. TaxID=2609467 RepID=UPI00261D1AD2|nr:DUF3168 domain-containing protein [Ferrovum sp.]